MKTKSSREGSILIMMTFIMIIAAMYVTVALFDIRGTVDQERLFKTKKHVTYLQNAIADYRINNPDNPLGSIDHLVVQPSGMSSCYLMYSSNFVTMQRPRGWCGPYLDTSLFLGTATAYREDAWGTGFTISSSLIDGAYTYYVKSCGEDLICGGANAADDITIEF